MKNILVIGFYFKNNLGDNFFIEAFQELFPDYNFRFVDTVCQDDLINIDAIFIGGGSFLYNAPPIGNLLTEMLKFKIFYISVGAETEFHPVHQQLMSKAQLIAIRTPAFKDKVLKLNNNTIVIPDLVYALQTKVRTTPRKQNSILVLNNIVITPCWNEPHWKHSSYAYFKSEVAQFFDELIDKKYNITFLPMCSNQNGSDEWASIEIANHMKYRNKTTILPHKLHSFEQIAEIFSSFSEVITQRYHGIVLSEMTNTPYISLFHHDKLKTAYPARGNSISYYGLNKQLLHDTFNSVNKLTKLAILSNSFDELVVRVRQIIGE